MKKYLVAALLISAFSSLQVEAKPLITYVAQSAADRCCLACNSTFSNCIKSRQDKTPSSACQEKYNGCIYACPDYKTCPGSARSPFWRLLFSGVLERKLQPGHGERFLPMVLSF